jgi:acetoacetyl-CoA synthetase
MLPVYEGEMQAAGLGMAVEIWDESGMRLRGAEGGIDLYQTLSFGPLGFWNDPDGQRFTPPTLPPLARRLGPWRLREITATAASIIHGRSDAVLNPGGVRIGTAEIYRQVERIPDEVLESIVVGQAGTTMCAWCCSWCCARAVELDDDLCARIRRMIRDNTTPRHVPAKIVRVADIPRTISGKIVELAVRNVVHGEAVKNTDALANPEALALYRDLPELRD